MSAPQANGTQAPLYARLWRRLFGNGEANLGEALKACWMKAKAMMPDFPPKSATCCVICSASEMFASMM